MRNDPLHWTFAHTVLVGPWISYLFNISQRIDVRNFPFIESITVIHCARQLYRRVKTVSFCFVLPSDDWIC